MKLLSRFVWLIVGISALVLLAISILGIRANREFERIKQSIGEEYNQLLDKVLAPEKAIIYDYCYSISTAASVDQFLSLPSPDPSIIGLHLDTMLLDYYHADAIWFFDGQGSPYYFFSPHGVSQSALTIHPDQVDQLVREPAGISFYINTNNKVFRVFGIKMRATQDSRGYFFAATEQNQYWLDRYQKEVNNSEIIIVPQDTILEKIDNKTIRIDRALNRYDGTSVARLIVTLKLPFLELWEKTSTMDNWLLSGALIIILIMVNLFIYIWVIAPLQKISLSLEKSSATDIQSLLKSSTEMGDVARMIGDYHQKKNELETSESIKRHIIEQAQVGIVIFDSLSKQIVTANPYACQLIGAGESQIIGSAYSSFFMPYEEEKTDLASETSQEKNYESTLLNISGHSRCILRNINKLSQDGRPVLMITFVDLSQIKDLQSKLEEEKLKLDLSMKNSGLNFFEFDAKSDSLVLPPEWDYLKKGKHKSVKRNVLDHVYPADLKIILENFEALENKGKDTFSVEFRTSHSTRGLIWICLSVLVTKRDDEYKPRQMIGLFEDITERINLQQELIKAKEKAEESDRMKSAYLANMSHKIRTPMNAIVGFANLLTEEGFSQEEKEAYIKIISHDTEQLLHLIDDIINMARLDAEQLDFSEKTFQVNQLLSELTDYYKSNEKCNIINFSTKTMLPDGKDLLTTDRVKLKVILTNLLNNAFKFTRSGSIELGYYINPVSQKIILYVKDTGIGIPEASKDKIFNRFYQADSQTEGTGLGLTISQGLAKLLKGQLSFDSKEGEGSSFYMELPFEQL